MNDGDQTRIDRLLEKYDRRKQDETQRLVQRARELEETRVQGAELLREHVLEAVRDAASRIEQVGHDVILNEMLDAYPPAVRLHMWVKPGALEGDEERPRHTLEFVWGDPTPDLMCVKRWNSAGLDSLIHQDQARPSSLGDLWTREQIHAFLSVALGV